MKKLDIDSSPGTARALWHAARIPVGMYWSKGHQEADWIESSHCFVSLIHFDTLLDHGSMVRILLLFACPTNDPSIFMVNPRRSRLCLLPSVRDFRSANDQFGGRLGSRIFWAKGLWLKNLSTKDSNIFQTNGKIGSLILCQNTLGDVVKLECSLAKAMMQKSPQTVRAAPEVLALNHRVNSQAWPCGCSVNALFVWETTFNTMQPALIRGFKRAQLHQNFGQIWTRISVKSKPRQGSAVQTPALLGTFCVTPGATFQALVANSGTKVEVSRICYKL